MKTIYKEWIDKNVDKPYGMCGEYTLKMQKVFPELNRIHGFYYCHQWGQRMHWWLVNEQEGQIVDPTADQFPSKGMGEYVELQPNELPLGKCLNCGEYTYESSVSHQFCTDMCSKEFRDSLI